MYVCMDCGHLFSTAETLRERHGASAPLYESIYVCPACQSGNFHKQNTTYCRFCGARLKNGAVDYCTEKCRRRGKRAWLKQKQRKQTLAESAVYKTVREAEDYNRKHGTKLSYGQYAALVKGRGK